MARDRQRAKQRRRSREPGAGGSAGGSARSRARDSGAGPADASPAPDAAPAPDSGTTPVPEPMEHAFPDVEQARMAEAGAGARPGDDNAEPEDFDSVTDPAVLEERQAARAGRKKRGRIITFLGHVVDELRRVQWPDRRQTGQGTAVTLGFVVIAGGFLGLMDAIWKPLVEAIL